MSGFVGPMPLAPIGSTGNNTHTSASLSPAAGRTCAMVVIEAVGATPTLTWKVQATLDPQTTNDAGANWFDLITIPSDSDTAAVSVTKTAVGAFPVYVSQSQIRFVRRIRVVTSANTNVTYRAELHQQYTN